MYLTKIIYSNLAQNRIYCFGIRKVCPCCLRKRGSKQSSAILLECRIRKLGGFFRNNLLKTKYVIATIHHIDEEKFKTGEHQPIFNFTKEHVNLYHAICEPTAKFLKTLNHNIKITQIPLSLYRYRYHKNNRSKNKLMVKKYSNKLK